MRYPVRIYRRIFSVISALPRTVLNMLGRILGIPLNYFSNGGWTSCISTEPSPSHCAESRASISEPMFHFTQEYSISLFIVSSPSQVPPKVLAFQTMGTLSRGQFPRTAPGAGGGRRNKRCKIGTCLSKYCEKLVSCLLVKCKFSNKFCQCISDIDHVLDVVIVFSF